MVMGYLLKHLVTILEVKDVQFVEESKVISLAQNQQDILLNNQKRFIQIKTMVMKRSFMLSLIKK